LHQADTTVDRRTWELGLAVAVRDGLRSGDIYLPGSRRHVSFANLIYDPTRWQHERDLAYTELALSQQPDDFITRLGRLSWLVRRITLALTPPKCAHSYGLGPRAAQRA
jgi:hypothetical protein